MNFSIDNSIQDSTGNLPSIIGNFDNFVYNNVFLTNNSNSSNYTTITSNILDTKINSNNSNSSNYTTITSNILDTKINSNNSNSSNYTFITSNILLNNLVNNYYNQTQLNISNTNSSNYTRITSNILDTKITLYDSWTKTGNNVFNTITSGNIGIGLNNNILHKLTIDGNASVNDLSIGFGNASNYLPNIGGSYLILNHNTFHNLIGANNPNPECAFIMGNSTSSGTINWAFYSGIVKYNATTNPFNSLRYDIGSASIQNTLQTLSGTNTFTPLLSMLYNGNTGMGTTNPSYKLDVNGSINSTSLFQNGTQIDFSSYAINTNLNISNTNSSNYTSITSNILLNNLINNYYNQTQLNISNTNSSNYTTITSNILLNNINARQSNITTYTIASGVTGGSLVFSAGTLTLTMPNNYANALTISNLITPISFMYKGTELSSILSNYISSGNITTSLNISTINGNNPIYISSTESGANNAIRIKNNSTYNAYIGVGGNTYGGNYANNLYFESASGSIILNTNGRTSASTPNMMIDTVGNVGIGTNNPTCALSINRTGFKVLSLYDNGLTNDFQYVGIGANSGLCFNNFSSDDNFQFRVGATATTAVEVVKITGSGGISCAGLNISGITAYDSEYETADNANKTNTYINFKSAGATSDWCYLRQIGGTNSYKLAFDFLDDGDDARFCIRNVQTSGTVTDIVTEVFTVDNANVTVNGTIIVGNANLDPNLQLGSTNGHNLGVSTQGNTFSTSAVANDLILRSRNNLLLQSGIGTHAIKIDTANNISCSGNLTTTGTITSTGNTLTIGNSTGATTLYLTDISTAAWKIQTGGYNLNFTNDIGGTFATKMYLKNDGSLISSNITLTTPSNYQIRIYPPTESSSASINTIQQGVGFNQNIAIQSATGSGNVGIGTSTNITSKLVIYGTSQLQPKLSLTGIEYYSGQNTNGDGIALMLGTNRTDNRQLFICDTAKLTQNTTNCMLRIGINATDTFIDSMATDGVTRKGLNIANAFYANSNNYASVNKILKFHGMVIPDTKAVMNNLILNEGAILGGTFGGDVFISSHWGVAININSGGTANGYGDQYASQTHVPGFAAFSVNMRTSTSETSFNKRLFVVMPSGNVGIGIPTSTPVTLLEVGSIAYNTGSQTFRYFNYETALTQNTFLALPLTDCCSKFNGSIWVTATIASSSDYRIKSNIEDINDDSALQMILAIQPKTYNYIDVIDKGNNKVYGFIAQQIKEVIPEAVSIEKSIIPNIYTVCNCSNNIISLANSNIEKLKINDKLSIIEENKGGANFIITDINTETNQIKINSNLDNSRCFVYGTEIDDFHTLDKNYIFTLNVCATQELYKLIQEQKSQIEELKNRLSILEAK